MIIYLDNCSFNRPFDDQNQIRIKIETEAKLYIQNLIRDKKIKMAWSYMISFENSVNPFEERMLQINQWQKYAVINIDENHHLLQKAEQINKQGIKPKDSLHIACALDAKCDYFITTDDHLIKNNDHITGVSIVSPITFLELIETQ